MAELKKKGDTYYFRCSYEERVLAEQAKFEWDAGLKLWKTPDIWKAIKLDLYADAAVARTFDHLGDNYRASKALTCSFKATNPPNAQWKEIQHPAIKYCMDRKHVLLADPMGSGKTACSIGAANETGCDTILVICPAVVKEGWHREMKTWYLGDKNIQVVYGTKAALSPKANIIIINYELVHYPNFLQQFSQRRFDLLIVDESHYLQNPQAKRTIATLSVEAYSGICDRHIALSGTPLKTKPMQLWPLLYSWCRKAIQPYSEYMDYGQHFCDAHINDRGVWDFKGSKNLDELSWRMRSYFMARRPKHAFRENDPTIIIKPLNIKKFKSYRKHEETVYGSVESRTAAKARMGQFIKKSNNKVATHAELGQLQKGRQELLMDKLPECVEFIRNVLDSEVDKLLVFGYHRAGLIELEGALSEYRPVLHIGGMSAKQKEKNIEAFVNDKECKVYLANEDAAGTGLDGLQKSGCHVCVFLEASGDPSILHQCISRLDRTGQKYQVIAYLLTVYGSQDEARIRKLYENEATFNKVVNG